MLRLALAGAIALASSSAALADLPIMPAELCAAPLAAVKPLVEADPTFVADQVITDGDAKKALTEMLRKAGEDIPDGISGYFLLNWSDVGVTYVVVWGNCLARARKWPDGVPSPFPAALIQPGKTMSGTGA